MLIKAGLCLAFIGWAAATWVGEKAAALEPGSEMIEVEAQGQLSIGEDFEDLGIALQEELFACKDVDLDELALYVGRMVAGAVNGDREEYDRAGLEAEDLYFTRLDGRQVDAVERAMRRVYGQRLDHEHKGNVQGTAAVACNCSITCASGANCSISGNKKCRCRCFLGMALCSSKL